MEKKENESVKVERTKKVREIFLDDLPRLKSENEVNENNSFINWQKSIGSKVKGVYDNIKFEVEIVDYNVKTKCLYIKYKDNDAFKIRTNHFSRCKLGKLLGKKTDEFKIEIGTHYKDEKRDLIITDKKYVKDNRGQKKKYYKYICNKCGFDCREYYLNGEYKEELWILEGGLLSGYGCACCCNNHKIAVLGINTIWDTDRWMCNLGVSEEDAKRYTRSSNIKVKVKCPDCGYTKNEGMNINNIYNRKSISCKKCGDSIPYPEKFIFNFLTQLNIDFCPQLTRRTFKWCGDYRYDFYFEINGEIYIVEAHGEQHYKRSFETCGGRTYEEEVKNDGIKKELAIKNGIKEENYIVINCRESEMEWIKDDILDNSRLNQLFDLSNIDWLKAEEFALSNRVKEACEIKRNNPNIKIVDISKIMKLNRDTISKYLKKGCRLGLCDHI